MVKKILESKGDIDDSLLSHNVESDEGVAEAENVLNSEISGISEKAKGLESSGNKAVGIAPELKAPVKLPEDLESRTGDEPVTEAEKKEFLEKLINEGDITAENAYDAVEFSQKPVLPKESKDTENPLAA